MRPAHLRHNITIHMQCDTSTQSLGSLPRIVSTQPAGIRAADILPHYAAL